MVSVLIDLEVSDSISHVALCLATLFSLNVGSWEKIHIPQLHRIIHNSQLTSRLYLRTSLDVCLLTRLHYYVDAPQSAPEIR